jgi:hypothetical protein
VATVQQTTNGDQRWPTQTRSQGHIRLFLQNPRRQNQRSVQRVWVKTCCTVFWDHEKTIYQLVWSMIIFNKTSNSDPCRTKSRLCHSVRFDGIF